MNHRMIVACIFALLFLTVFTGNAQTGTAVVDWRGLQEAWNAYYPNPSEAGAGKIINLLPENIKIPDFTDGSLVSSSIYEHLGVLEGEIYLGNPNAVKLGFGLFTIAGGALETALNKIIGNLIAFNPRLFLEELAAHRNLFPLLNPILGSFLQDNPDDRNAKNQEKKLRISALETVKDKTLKSLRNECIKIIKKL